VGYPDFIGNGVGDSLFLITVWEPVQVTLSTCSPRTNFESRIVVYDGNPTFAYAAGGNRHDQDNNVTVMGRTPSDVDCGFVTVDLSAYGTYFVVVTGALDNTFHSIPLRTQVTPQVRCKPSPTQSNPPPLLSPPTRRGPWRRGYIRAVGYVHPSTDRRA
jgi:hypothetical protein